MRTQRPSPDEPWHDWMMRHKGRIMHFDLPEHGQLAMC